ncbi:MAG: ligase-associated DNA damage response endonuclease PdeM [Pseudomonadota bacterium]
MASVSRKVADATWSAAAHVPVGDAVFVADRSGALWWPDADTLIVADLHLEKGSSFARRGAFLPPYDSRTTLRLLGDAIDRYAPRAVWLLGDSFHDREGMAALGAEERRTLGSLQRGRTWVWVTGNHDPEIAPWLGGEIVGGFEKAGICFRHEPTGSGAPEIAGHLHPVAKLIRHGRGLRRRCFVTDGCQLVLPAFGAFTGGLNICDPTFLALFGSETPAVGVWMLGQDAVYPVSARDLRGD